MQGFGKHGLPWRGVILLFKKSHDFTMMTLPIPFKLVSTVTSPNELPVIKIKSMLAFDNELLTFFMKQKFQWSKH